MGSPGLRSTRDARRSTDAGDNTRVSSLALLSEDTFRWQGWTRWQGVAQCLVAFMTFVWSIFKVGVIGSTLTILTSFLLQSPRFVVSFLIFPVMIFLWNLIESFLNAGIHRLMMCVQLPEDNLASESTSFTLQSWTYWRCQWLRQYCLSQWHSPFTPIQGFSILSKVWLRAAGICEMAWDVEVADPTSETTWLQPPSTVRLKEHATLVSGAWVGSEAVETGQWVLRPCTIGHHAFVGNYSGSMRSVVPAETLIGSLAVIRAVDAEYGGTGQLVQAGLSRSSDGSSSRATATSRTGPSVWVGNPALQRMYSAMSNEATGQLELATMSRLAIELLITLAITTLYWVVVAIPIVATTYAIPVSIFLNNANTAVAAFLLLSGWSVFSYVVDLTLFFGMAIGTKRLVSGTFTSGEFPFFSSWFFRRGISFNLVFFAMSQYGNLLFDTEFMNFILRCLGAQIEVGARLLNPVTAVLEMDLIRIGAGTVVQDGAIIQPHTFEGRVMRCAHIDLDRGISIGKNVIVLAGAVIEEGVSIAALSLVMKEENIKRLSRVSGALLETQA